ncbi:MAG: hypothetical protein JOY66_22680, partial [Acetobacteraceae bacterium]|nr:hypothetical protein [Acetobacteraceae bacterium]
MSGLLRVLWLWRGRALWLGLGLALALGSLAAGVGLMALAGGVVGTALLAGALLAPVALDVCGVARVVLRYLERLATHAATFRALTDLRVWFFRGLARGAAGPCGSALAWRSRSAPSPPASASWRSRAAWWGRRCSPARCLPRWR